MTHRGGRGGARPRSSCGFADGRACASGSVLFGHSHVGLHLLAGFELAHGWPIQFQPISVVDDAIEDGIGEGWFADDVVPLVERKLAGNERGGLAMAVFDDLHQIAPLIGGEPIRSPIVKHQEIGLDERAEQTGKATIAVCELQI